MCALSTHADTACCICIEMYTIANRISAAHLRGLERVVCWEVNVQKEDTSLVGRALKHKMSNLRKITQETMRVVWRQTYSKAP